MQRWSNVTLRAQQALPRRAGREATEPGGGKRRGGAERRRSRRRPRHAQPCVPVAWARHTRTLLAADQLARPAGGGVRGPSSSDGTSQRNVALMESVLGVLDGVDVSGAWAD
jgi:hypothetical protein